MAAAAHSAFAAWLPSAVRRELDRFAARTRVWIVGGAILDFLDGLPFREADAIAATSPRVLRDLGAVAIGGTQATHRRQTAAGWIDISPLHGRDLAEDLAQRDFSIHAIAVAWPEAVVVDPWHGRRDRERRLLRAPGDHDPFGTDPIRILRGFRRLAGGYRFAPTTAAAAVAAIPALATAAPERKGEALLKLLLQPRAGAALRAMAQWPGLLQAVHPAFAAMAALPAPAHHRWNAWQHTTFVIDALPPEPSLRLAALFHDTGKVSPWLQPGATLPPDGRPVSEGHAERSAAILDAAAKAWSIERGTRERAVALVAAHTFSPAALSADAGALRYWLASHADIRHDLLQLRRADRWAAGAAKPYDDIERLARDSAKMAATDFPRQPSQMALAGNALFARVAIAPPLRARVLDAVWRWVLEDPDVRNHADAIARRAAEVVGEHAGYAPGTGSSR